MVTGAPAAIIFRPNHGPFSHGYRICTTTVMDTSDPGLTFDSDGNCQFVKAYKQRREIELKSGAEGKEHFRALVDRIRRPRGFDCICGVSGGVDSSLVLLRAVEAGLRPLAVHVDNGWNHELAVANIERITRALSVELHTEVLDWEEFRDLQRSFFLASVPNVEMVTDHAINATLFRLASEVGAKAILSGSNLSSEAFLPTNAGLDNKDWTHIRAVHRRFGRVSVQRFPHLSAARFAYLILVRRVRFIPILNYLEYNRDAAKAELAAKCGWRDYGRKHGESRFTRFFQEHYLPVKFGVDKRRAHLSCQILAGHISREAALESLRRPLWQPGEVETETDFVCKKLGFSMQEWAEIMAARPRSHFEYPTNPLFRSYESPGYQWLRSIATGRATYRAARSPNDGCR
jgi:N-acetyl sugar amidotransferase